jgi:TRAP-type C4-dicarboxylate transport system permease small subunit
MLLRTLGHHIGAIINQASRLAGAIATIFIMAIMVLTVSDVLLRFFLNRPIPGSVELCEYFIVVGGFLGLAWCALKGGHVKVGMIIDRLSPRSQSVADCINYLIALSVVPLAAWRLFVQARIVQLERMTSANLEIPAYPFYLLASLGFALLTLVILVFLFQSIVNVAKDTHKAKK